MKRDIIKEVSNFRKLSPNTSIKDACLLLGIKYKDYQLELNRQNKAGEEMFNKFFGGFRA